MAAIITDKIRILNAKNFVNDVISANNSYYSFVGLTNSNEIQGDWDQNPPSPKDNFDEENNYWDTMIALKKINASDIRQVITRRQWFSGNTYDMYRHDYSRSKVSAVSGSTNLYSSFYYVMNSDYRVYICLQNGTTPETPNGKPSLDEPTFVDLEPRSAGTSGDGYIWKYLYTIRPSDIVKFESTDFIPVPSNWNTDIEHLPIRENATDGSIKIVNIKSRGTDVGPPNRIYTRVPIKGNGVGAECTIIVNNDSKVESIIVTEQGSNYTYGNVDLFNSTVPTGSVQPEFDVIISPEGGHGADIYNELGAYNVLLYSRLENDNQNPDFIVGNQIARIGLVKNPRVFDSTENLNLPKASSLSAIKLTGIGYDTATFNKNAFITQLVGVGVTAAGRVVNYDQVTGVLKYWQDRTLVGFTTSGTNTLNPSYGYDLISFTSSPSVDGNLTITGGSVSLQIESSFSGSSTVINNRTYYLGQSFVSGVSNPEVQKYSGDIVYVDNRPPIIRSQNQKEDIKIVLQF